MGLFGRSKKKDESVEQLKSIFDKFEYYDLETFCTEVIGKKPESIGNKENLSKIEVLDYIWNRFNEGKFDFEKTKEFAIKKRIISQDFFD